MSDFESELVAQCQLGNRNAQHELYEKYHLRVYRLALRMVGAGEAGDVTQQVFLQTYRKIDQFSGRSSFSTWLFRVTANECLQHRRRAGRAKVDSLINEPPSNLPLHSDQTEQREFLEQALNQVGPELSSIFLLREVEGLSYTEIADVLEISEGTVASRLNRARRKLREIIEDLGWSP